jgi:eukaryotic-like serine/threonine-protein kinase
MATAPGVKSPEIAAETQRKVSISAVLDNPRLPSPPAVVLQIVEKASRPDCDLDAIANLLSQDSGLCSQVLKTVNSGLFGLSKPVSSLKHAVRMLGVRPLRSLVLSLALPAIGPADKDEIVLKYWQESVAGAVIARELSQWLRRPDPEDDLVAGLLRDLGILVLREAFAADYRDLWSRCSRNWAQRQCDEEKATFGVDHAEISAGLLHSWYLPPEVYLPIRHHHNPEGCTDVQASVQQRAWILCFAAKVAMLDNNAAKPISELLHIAKGQFGMDQAGLIKFLAKVMPAIKEFATLLKVDVSRMPNYANIIATGCQELVKLSVENAGKPASAPRLGKESTREAKSSSNYCETRIERRPAGLGAKTSPDDTLPDFDISFLDKMGPEGFRLNDYFVREILGRGGMGVVFKAYDPSLDRFAAIKMMLPQNLVLSEARERFQREARAVAAIQHENVVTIYAVSEIHSLPYLVMEYLPGMTLEDRLIKEGSLPLADVIQYGRKIAAGLHAAHQRNVIHRDIKPANVLLGREPGTVKITDFGLARMQNESRLSHEGMVVGTPLYMAPEQFTGLNVDHRADFFSLGSLLYTLCAGKPPFEGATVLEVMRQVSTVTPQPLRYRRPDVPLWLGNVINRLLVKAAAQRFQTATEVLQAFDANA